MGVGKPAWSGCFGGFALGEAMDLERQSQLLLETLLELRLPMEGPSPHEVELVVDGLDEELAEVRPSGISSCPCDDPSGNAVELPNLVEMVLTVDSAKPESSVGSIEEEDWGQAS